MDFPNFNSLPEEKQKKILSAALSCFGRNGYNKTSVADIALAAEISKASVFHYFGSKKELYLYLYEFAAAMVASIVTEGSEDFFESWLIAGKARRHIGAEYPGFLDFMSLWSKHTDYGIFPELFYDEAVWTGETYDVLFKNVDWSKFKAEYDHDTIMNLCGWVSTGVGAMLPGSLSEQEVYEEEKRYLEILKKTLYREEYL